MSSELITAIRHHQSTFRLELSDDALAALERFYALVKEHNPLLHLVGPMPAEDFAVRHVLESLTMLEFLPEGSRFADVLLALRAHPAIAATDLDGAAIMAALGAAVLLFAGAFATQVCSVSEKISKRTSESGMTESSTLNAMPEARRKQWSSSR